MIALLLRFSPYIIGVLAVLGVVWQVNSWRVDANKLPAAEAQIETLNAQIISEREKNQRNEILTQKVSEKYENAITQRDTDIARLRQRPASCVAVRSSAETSKLNAASAAGIKNIGVGISSDWLIDFANKSETDRLKVLGLQDFINQVYQSNGQ